MVFWTCGSAILALSDPNGVPLPKLPGADPARKDIFFEIGYMYTNVPLTYGGTEKPAHSHLPAFESLTMVAEAFAKKNIQVHFDVGNNYQDVNGRSHLRRTSFRGRQALETSLAEARLSMNRSPSAHEARMTILRCASSPSTRAPSGGRAVSG